MTSDELITVLSQEMKNLDDDLESDDYTNAVNAAQWETWDLPQTDDFKVYWTKERSKRHLFFMLMTGVATKFHAKSYHIDQKFLHLRDVVKMLDEKFEKVKEDFPDAFPVLSDSAIQNYEVFGTYIRSGFQYDGVGRDTTYETTNEPVFSPDLSDEE